MAHEEALAEEAMRPPVPAWVRFFALNILLYLAVCAIVALSASIVALVVFGPPTGFEQEPPILLLVGGSLFPFTYFTITGAAPSIAAGLILLWIVPRLLPAQRRPAAVLLALLAIPVGWLAVWGAMGGFYEGFDPGAWLLMLTPIGLALGLAARLPRLSGRRERTTRDDPLRRG